MILIVLGSLCGESELAIALIFASDMSPSFHPKVRNECDKSVTSTLLVTPTGYGGVLKYLTNQEKTGRGEKIRTSGPCLPKAF